MVNTRPTNCTRHHIFYENLCTLPYYGNPNLLSIVDTFLKTNIIFYAAPPTGRGSCQYTDMQLSCLLPCVALQTSDLGLTENVGDNNSRCKFEIWFRKRTSSDIFVLQASAGAVKDEWVREISRLLWNQAIKNRGQCACVCAWGRREGEAVC